MREGPGGGVSIDGYGFGVLGEGGDERQQGGCAGE
jgi:hypothetical protein